MSILPSCHGGIPSASLGWPAILSTPQVRRTRPSTVEVTGGGLAGARGRQFAETQTANPKGWLGLSAVTHGLQPVRQTGDVTRRKETLAVKVGLHQHVA